MLDDRKAAILRAVVQEYIHTAQPVGSATWHARGTSASRPPPSATRWRRSNATATWPTPTPAPGGIPTDKGYRFFVDSIARPQGMLEPAQKQQVQTFFARAHGQLEEMLHDTSCLLSSLTYAAMVVPPQHEDATVHSVPGWRWWWRSCPPARSRRPRNRSQRG